MHTRFAPSPTGHLHIGNARTALLCWLYARKNGGRFTLRLDDTDTERSKEEYAASIREDLAWLGIGPDAEVKQSDRFALYDAAVEKLKQSGRLYPCYETEEELEIKRKMQLSRGKPPIYDREALQLTDAQKAKFEAEGRKPHWRFKLTDGSIEWLDEIQGGRHFEPANLSDPIVIRANGIYTYMLPSTVDDIDMKITHVLRGEDHISNTAIQIQMFEALGGKVPVFAHNALITSKEGKLSKRTGGFSLGDLRTDGIEPMALNSFLSRVGTSGPIEVRLSLEELIQEFDIHSFGKSQTIYDPEDIARLNEKLVHALPFEAVKARLPQGAESHFWDAVRGNIKTVKEAAEWWNLLHGDIPQATEDKDFLAQAATLLPPAPWDETTWNSWTNAIKEKTGRKGKELFMPIRKALTGLEHGPEMKVILPLIGREKVEKRLKA